MKKALSTLLLFTLILTTLTVLPLSSSADDLWVDADVDALWERKLEEHPFGRSHITTAGVFWTEPFLRESNLLTTFLYTDAFKELEFELRYYDAWDNYLYWAGFLGGDIEGLYLPSVRVGEGSEVGSGLFGYMYSEELNAVLETCFDTEREELYRTAMWRLPLARACIEAFDISKEELKKACEQSRTDPDSIRQVLHMFSDEQFESFKAYGILESHLDESYIFDALYLEDESQCIALCMEHFLFRAGDKEYRWDKYNTGYLDDPEQVAELKKQNLATPSFRTFLEYTKSRLKNPTEEQKQTLAELEALAYADPPETGDSTAAYALIFTLAALPLAGFGVYEWKRRRRAV